MAWPQDSKIIRLDSDIRLGQVNMGLGQDLRQVSLVTTLGPDVVVFERLSASSRLSELYTITVDVISPGGAITVSGSLDEVEQLLISQCRASLNGSLLHA